MFVHMISHTIFFWGGVLMTENMLSMGQKKSFHSLFKKVLLFFLSGQCNEVYNFHPLVQVDLRMSEYKKKTEPQMLFPLFLCSHQDFADPLYTEGGTFHLVTLSSINSFVHKTISSTDQCVSCFKYQLMTMFCIWNLKVSYWFL